MVPITAWGLAGLLLLLAMACLLDRNLWRACLVFVAFAILMALAWLQLGALWLALAELGLGAMLTGGALLGLLRGRGTWPPLPACDETARRSRLTAPLRWLMSLTWLGLAGLALHLLAGGTTRLAVDSVATLFAMTGLLVISLGLWAFASQRHLLRWLLAFNLLGSGVMMVLGGLAGPSPGVQALILIALAVGCLGSLLGARLVLELHALSGQVSLATSAETGA